MTWTDVLICFYLICAMVFFYKVGSLNSEMELMSAERGAQKLRLEVKKQAALIESMKRSGRKRREEVRLLKKALIEEQTRSRIAIMTALSKNELKRLEMKSHNHDHKETKMLIASIHVKNAFIWIDRALRRSRIPDEERRAMEDVRRLIIETDMAFVNYCNKYIYNGAPTKKLDQEVEEAFGKRRATEE